jgi:REP element-mobilizing transposase RayT
MLYHIFARGNAKACIFVDDEDYERFLGLLAASVVRFGVRCAAYCALWNHYHLLLAAGEQPISRMMQQLNSKYSQQFNRRHNRVGHVLQGRFGSRIVEDGAYVRAVLRYLALNPVAAGRVEQPEDWPWSSYRFAIGADPPPDFLALDRVWAAFGTGDETAGRLRFGELVGSQVQETLDDPCSTARHAWLRVSRRGWSRTSRRATSSTRSALPHERSWTVCSRAGGSGPTWRTRRTRPTRTMRTH